MTITLRKGSAITKALGDAQSSMRYQLHQAVKDYLTAVRDCADTLAREGTDDIIDPAKFRTASLKRVDALEKKRQEALRLLDIAVAEYDLNAKELDAWLTAAQAAGRIVG